MKRLLLCSSFCLVSCLVALPEPDADCGNGIVESGESCDGSDLAGETCSSRGYNGGVLSCLSSCMFDLSQCFSSTCGNGTINTSSNEVCDSTDLGGETCESLGYDSGVLSCGSDCQFDISLCGGNAQVVYQLDSPLDGDGATYIDTGWIPPTDVPWSVELTFFTNPDPTSSGHTTYGTSGIYDDSNNMHLLVGLGIDSDRIIIGFGSEHSVLYSVDPNTEYTFKVEFDGDSTATYYINGTFLQDITSDYLGTNLPFYIGARNEQGGPNFIVNYLITACTIVEYPPQ